MNHAVIGLRAIRTHENSSGGYKYFSFSIEKGGWLVHNWLLKTLTVHNCWSENPRTGNRRLLCWNHCNAQIYSEFSLSRVIFFFQVFHAIPCCPRLLTFVHSLTNSFTTPGVEKFPEYFPPHFGAFIDIWNPHFGAKTLKCGEKFSGNFSIPWIINE